MAYIKFKELTKYFDFKTEVDLEKLPDYAKEYVEDHERIVFAYKNNKELYVFSYSILIKYLYQIILISYQ